MPYLAGAPAETSAAECVRRGRPAGECSGNTVWTGPHRNGLFAPPPALAQTVRKNLEAGFKYVVVGGANDYSNPKVETQEQACCDPLARRPARPHPFWPPPSDMWPHAVAPLACPPSHHPHPHRTIPSGVMAGPVGRPGGEEKFVSSHVRGSHA